MSRTDDFVTALMQRANGRRRLQVSTDVWLVFEGCFPDDARASDAREKLSQLLSEAEYAAKLTLSKKTDRLGSVALPTFVTLPQTSASMRRKSAGPWVDALSWTQGLLLDERQYELLDRVNNWLRDRPNGEPPIVPAEERSLQVFGSEKVIGGQIGGRTLWQPGHLDAALLRFENVPMPFPYVQIGDGDRLLMVENTAAFRTCSKLLSAEEGHPYYAVAFGQGKWAPKTVASAKSLPTEIIAVDYWGDLDAEGLKIAGDVCEAGRKAGLETECHPRLWQLLLDCEPVPTKTNVQRPAAFTSVLPAGLRRRADAVLASGQRIPQERLGYEVLRQTPRWWDHATAA